MAEAICEWCGKPFVATESRQAYCGNPCADANRRRCQDRATRLLEDVAADPASAAGAFDEALRIFADLQGHAPPFPAKRP